MTKTPYANKWVVTTRSRSFVTMLVMGTVPVLILTVLMANFGLSMTILGGILVLVAVAAWLFSYVLPNSSVGQTAEHYRDFAERITAGNLNTRVQVSDTTGFLSLAESFNRMADNVAQVIRELRDSAHAIADSATTILDATNDQVGTMTDQDAGIMETSSTVNEVRATVTETAERAQAVAEMAQFSVEVSQNGRDAVSASIGGMTLIGQRVGSIADNILVLSEQTQQIGDIIAAVSTLADHTKLLALNASIEAARAGNEGRGFAVVATEISSLAQRSRDATLQIRDILSQIQQATNNAVMVTEQGTKDVEDGKRLVARAGEAIDRLDQTIREAAEAAVQIAASTRQQTIGVDQLSDAMTRIRELTAQSTKTTMDVERTARTLGKVSRQMEEKLGRYTL